MLIPPMTPRQRLFLALVLAVAFALRLGYGLMQDPLAPYDRAAGSDTWWYLEYGYRQVTDIEMEPLSSAPLYVMLVGGVRYALQPERPTDAAPVMLPAPVGGGLDIVSVAGEPVGAVVVVMRVLQAILSTLTVYFGFRLGWALCGDVRVGLGVALVLALSLAMIISAAEIMTETLYLFFVMAALALYTEVSSDMRHYRRAGWVLLLVGGLLALATLTRAVLILFPLGLLLHALLVMLVVRVRRGHTWLRWASVRNMLFLYVLLCSIWTVYYYQRWGEVVIGAKGLSAFFYLGTQGDWQGPESTDTALGATPENPINDADYLRGASQTIQANPTAYLQQRLSNLLDAYMQPYGTVSFSGESLKALAQTWLQEGATLGGLARLVRGEAFFPKLMLYLWHYGGIGLGLLGVVFSLRHWRTALPALGFIAYVTLLHTALLALPRYLFPTLPFWWLFGVFALVRLWDAARGWRARRSALAAQS